MTSADDVADPATTAPRPNAGLEEGARLSRLAGLQFERAADRWYRALGVEVISSILGGATVLFGLIGDPATWVTLGAIVLLGAAYVTRLLAEDIHETAQTMRRQAALSEGLGWKIEPIQLEEWRRRAGTKMLRRVDSEPREGDYYATREAAGKRRMAEMTRESAFYTRHLILAIRSVLTLALVVVAVVLLIVVYFVLLTPAAAVLDADVAHVLATVVLIAIAVDAGGWWLRLTRQSSAIRGIEADLDRLLAKPQIEMTDVLRLVAEYDCELVNSIPIHPRIFSWQHDEIRELWRLRNDARRD
jgi:hypothetical protein